MLRQDMLESLPIGILILNSSGAPVLVNSYARQICRRLLKNHPELAPSSPFKFPQSIQRIAQAVKESRDLFPEQPVIIEDKVLLKPEAAQKQSSKQSQTAIQIRARWLDLETEPYILIMLEAKQQLQPQTVDS
jgi:hypothetical protein